MKTCHKCREYTKVRKRVKIFESLYSKAFNIKEEDYICEKCENAEKIEKEIRSEKAQKEFDKKTKAWIKERDKLLKEAERRIKK